MQGPALQGIPCMAPSIDTRCGCGCRSLAGDDGHGGLAGWPKSNVSAVLDTKTLGNGRTGHGMAGRRLEVCGGDGMEWL